MSLSEGFTTLPEGILRTNIPSEEPTAEAPKSIEEGEVLAQAHLPFSLDEDEDFIPESLKRLKDLWVRDESEHHEKAPEPSDSSPGTSVVYIFCFSLLYDWSFATRLDQELKATSTSVQLSGSQPDSDFNQSNEEDVDTVRPQMA